MLECNNNITFNDKKNRRYEGKEAIGVGGFGVIYLAIDTVAAKKVAIKVLKLRNKEKEFQQELDIVKQIEHRSVISVTDIFRSQKGVLCAVMNYADNGSVLSNIIKHGRYTEEKTRSFMKSILEGLEAIHQKGIIHNDIKAANILINKNSALIADFGASIDTKTGTLKSTTGSPHWMSPEAAGRLKLTTKSDIWSIGILTIEMITGKPPMSSLPGASALLILKESKKIPELNTLRVSDVCMSFIKMCLQANPRNRPTASELLAHPFISYQTQLFNPDKQSSSFHTNYQKYVNIALDIENGSIDQEKIGATTDFIEDAFQSLKSSDEIEAVLLLFEIVVLNSTHFCITNYQNIFVNFVNFVKIEHNHVFYNEALKIIYITLINARFLIGDSEIRTLMEKIDTNASPLRMIILSTMKNFTREDIDGAIMFVTNFKYDKILSYLSLFYSFVNIPNKLKISLEKQMHKYAQTSLTATLHIINQMRLSNEDIIHFASMLDDFWSLDFLSYNNLKIFLNIVGESFVDVLSIKQQRKLAISIISQMNEIFYCYHDQEMINKLLCLLIYMKKLDIRLILNRQIDFWKIIETAKVEIISHFCSKYPEEFDKNINTNILLQRFSQSMKNIPNNDFDFIQFIKIFNHSRAFQLKFIMDQFFVDFCRVLPQLPLIYQNYGLEIIQTLMEIEKKPENFHLCLIGPLTRIILFSKNENANIILNTVKLMK